MWVVALVNSEDMPYAADVASLVAMSDIRLLSMFILKIVKLSQHFKQVIVLETLTSGFSFKSQKMWLAMNSYCHMTAIARAAGVCPLAIIDGCSHSPLLPIIS